MKVFAEFTVGQMYMLVVEIDKVDMSHFLSQAEAKNARLSTSEELMKLHKQLWSTDDLGKIEQTVALGNRHSSGNYTFVGGGIFDYTLTGIIWDQIQPGHKLLLVKL